MAKGKGKGWHRDRARHSAAAKKGWREKTHLLTSRLSSQKIAQMKVRLGNLQRDLSLLKKAGKEDTKTYEMKLDEAWEIFSELEKRGKV